MKNAADESQVKESARSEKRLREREISDLATVLSLAEGRRFCQRLLSVCKVSESLFHPSALIHYRSGAQDVGHIIAKDLLQANPSVGAQMLADSYKDKGDLNNE